MIPFKRLELARRQEVFDWFHQAGRLGCEYSFVNLYLWGRQHAAFVEGYLVVFSHFYGHSMYLFPSGHGPLKPVLEALREDAREREIPFRLTSMSMADCRAVEELYPGQFKFYPDRDGFDYLYEIDHLADLKGKKYQQKRNHINRFLESCPDWRAEPLPPAWIPTCRDLLDRWYRIHLEADPHMQYHLEQLALDRAFQNYEALGLDGLLLLDGDKPIAMTIGSLISPTVYDVNFEKALGEVPGDYAMINRTFARYIREKYPQVQYLDREDDLGLPGLRKAKESYHPDRMVEQYSCVLKEDIDAV